VKGITELLNGEYGLTSEVNEGSTFWFEIPIEIPLGSEKISDLKPRFESIVCIHPELDFNNYLKGLANAMNIQFSTLKKDSNSSLTFIIIDQSMVDTKVFETQKYLYIYSNSKFENYQVINNPLQLSSLLTILTAASPVTNLQTKSPKNNFSNYRILIVDDNAIISKSLKKLLNNLEVGHVDEASNGKIALEKVTKNELYDIIFMDIQMPVMNGIEATTEIRNLDDSLKSNSLIVALTGNAISKSIEDQCKEWKMNDICLKPVKSDELVKMIKKHQSKISDTQIL
jgi:CheY-like chemotaxis protein